MLLTTVIFLLTSTRNMAGGLNCPYLSLVPPGWRADMLSNTNINRRDIATIDSSDRLPPPKQMNELAWNCETEFSLNKIQEKLILGNNNVTYRNFGVNVGIGSETECSFNEMSFLVYVWTSDLAQIPSDLQYDGNPNTATDFNVLKWNATEMACAYRSFDNENAVRLICAYNVRGDVSGELLYEKGNGACKQGTQCGDGGTCVDSLCRVPTLHPDVAISIYTPSLSCSNSIFMHQFSRYYAVNMHNYYRSLVASGWAESKLTLFTPRAAKMAALSYDCSLEQLAARNIENCQNVLFRTNEGTTETGCNIAFIQENNILRERALEKAISKWFSELQEFDIDPNSVWADNSAVINITNIIYDKYKTVGCAVNDCATEGFTVVECRYGPKIIQSGDTIYNEGVPCSKCDNSDRCAYEALCQPQSI